MESNKLVRSRELLKQISHNKKVVSYEVCGANHTTSQSNKLNNYLDNAVFADVTISCQGKHIKCHKLILAASSSYFEDIFAEESMGHQLYFVAVVNVKHGVLKKLLEYIYKGSVIVPSEDIGDFLTCGDQLGIDGLCERGEQPEMNATDYVENSMNFNDNDSSLPFGLKVNYTEANSTKQEKIPAKRKRKEKSANTHPPIKSARKTENAFVSLKSVGKTENSPAPVKSAGKAEKIPGKSVAKTENVHVPLKKSAKKKTNETMMDPITNVENILSPIKPNHQDRKSMENALVEINFEAKKNEPTRPTDVPTPGPNHIAIESVSKAENVDIPIESVSNTKNVDVQIESRVKTEMVNIIPLESETENDNFKIFNGHNMTAEIKTEIGGEQMKNLDTLRSELSLETPEIVDVKSNVKLEDIENNPGSAFSGENSINMDISDVVTNIVTGVCCGMDEPILNTPREGEKENSLGTPNSSSGKKGRKISKKNEPEPTGFQEGKSMPIHCIIEVSSRDRDLGKCETSGGNSNVTVTPSEIGTCRLSPSDINSINNSSLHVKDSSLAAAENKVVEVDDFVIIPAGTPFQDVVTTVLTLLGYPKDTIRQAQGTIALRNWKPLRLDQVCDSPHKTVGDILNDLTNHATLRVLVTRAKGGTAEDLKEKLLRLLLAQSSTLLMGAGCPLDEVTLSQLVKGHWPQNLAEDVKRRFDQWYSTQHQQSVGGLVESLQQQQHHHQHSHQHQSHSMGQSVQHPIGGNSGTGLSSTHHHSHLVNGSSGGTLSAVHHHHQHDLQSSKSYEDDHANHPVFHGLATQKTRMRTSFDPEMELPKLQQWFAENPHPSRHQIQQYVRDLNLLDCRKDRKPLDVNNVIYWFKNARAAQKRNEMRYNGLSPHQSFSHHHPHPHSQNPSHHHHHHSGALLAIQGNGSEMRGERDGSHEMHSLHGRRRLNSGEQDRENNNEPEHDHDSVNDNSASSCRDSDDQDTKENMHEYAENDQENVRELNRDRESDVDREKESRAVGADKRVEESGGSVVVKEEHEEDFISVDVELNEANGTSQNLKSSNECCNNEPKDLSSAKSQSDGGNGEGEEKTEKDDKRSITVGGEEKHLSISNDMRRSPENETELITGDASNNSSSTSASPRSSPGISPNHHYDFAGAPSMVSRYHPFFDHPSFMAYRHFNSFNFGQNFSGPNGTDGHGSYEASLGVVGRKALLPMSKPSPGMDIFHDFPSGVAMVPTRGAGGHLGGGPTSAETLSRLRGDEMFPPRPASSAEIISSIINSNRGELGLSPLNLGSHHPGQSSLALDERRKRNRTFIDPVTEVPRLEQWFGLNTHPSHNLILKYTDELNRMPYRQKFPKLEPKNVQFWFKNRRAKCKRLKMTL